jgi:nicotinamide riboside transporter PnuC
VVIQNGPRTNKRWSLTNWSFVHIMVVIGAARFARQDQSRSDRLGWGSAIFLIMVVLQILLVEHHRGDGWLFLGRISAAQRVSGREYSANKAVLAPNGRD